MTSSRKRHSRFRSSVIPLLSLLAITGLFRSTQNAFQTTIGPIGRYVLHLDPSVIGIGIALAGGVTTATSLLLVARIRHNRLNLTAQTGALAIALAILVIILGKGISGFLASLLIFGASGGLVMPILATLAGRIEGVSRDRAISAYTVALSASLAIGPFFESLVLGANHDNLIGGIASFLPFPMIALVLFTFLRTPSVPTTHSTQRATTRSKLRENPQFRIAVIALLLYQVPFIAITAFGALIAHYEYGVTVALAQLSFTVFFLVSLSTRSLLVWRHPGKRENTLLRLSALLTFVGVLVLAIGHNLVFLFVAMVLLGIPHGLVYPLSISSVARTTSPHDVPRANAGLFAATSAASIVSPSILGETASLFGYQAISLVTLVPVIVLGIWLWLPRSRIPFETRQGADGESGGSR